MSLCKNYLSCWWAVFATWNMREELNSRVCIYVYIFLHVFISIYREFERRWKTASSSLFLYRSWFDTFDPLLDLKLVQWNQIQIHSIKYGKVSALVTVIFVVYRGHCAELVVAGTGVDIVVVLFVHLLCQRFSVSEESLFLMNLPLDTICFWWVCLWWTCFWWRHLQKLFLQTHSDSDFPGALSFRCFSSFSLKFLCSLIHSIRTSCK